MDYALILNGEVIKVLPDYKVQEGDLLEPHPVKQIPYLVPVEKVAAKSFDPNVQVKETLTHSVVDGVVIAEEKVRDKTEEEVQAMRDRKLREMERLILKEFVQNSSRYQDFKTYLGTLSATEIANAKLS